MDYNTRNLDTVASSVAFPGVTTTKRWQGACPTREEAPEVESSTFVRRGLLRGEWQCLGEGRSTYV